MRRRKKLQWGQLSLPPLDFDLPPLDFEIPELLPDEAADADNASDAPTPESAAES